MEFYRAELKKSPHAIDYLKGRGLTGEIAARFRIGYAPDGWQPLKEAFEKFGAEIPDPLADETFSSAILRWDALHAPTGKKRLTLVRELLKIRRDEIAPYLFGVAFNGAGLEGNTLIARWTLAGGRRLALLANLSSEIVERSVDFEFGRVIWGGAPTDEIGPWAVFWSIGPG